MAAKQSKDELVEAVGRLTAEKLTLQAQLNVQGNALSQAHDAVATLKEKLLETEIKLAKERGYRERVNEDDTVREDLVHLPPDIGLRPELHHENGVTLPQPKRSLSRRAPQDRPRDFLDYGAGIVSGKHDEPKHWVNL